MRPPRRRGKRIFLAQNLLQRQRPDAERADAGQMIRDAEGFGDLGRSRPFAHR